MKRPILIIITVLLVLSSLCGCENEVIQASFPSEKKLQMSDLVGVWKNQKDNLMYRFTPSGNWFCYDSEGKVLSTGKSVLKGDQLTVTDSQERNVVFTWKEKGRFYDEQGNTFIRSEIPNSLLSSGEYKKYLNQWYEEGNLNGDVLTITSPDLWSVSSSSGKVLQEGSVYAYAGEEEYLYLHEKSDGDFVARLYFDGQTLMCETYSQNLVIRTAFDSKENSQNNEIYFLKKNVRCNYTINSGYHLLRGGGAVYNEDHDYKKMPVSCSISLVEDTVNENGLRQVKVDIEYRFFRRDFPILSGNRYFSSVLFSQYDYYTGKLFYLDDSIGNDNQGIIWSTEYGGKEYEIQCRFSSKWEYTPDSENVVVSFRGTYDLTLPADYNGFVFCLRPVYNSYSQQVSASISPQEGTLMMEDLGGDAEKAIFCRLPKDCYQPGELSSPVSF